MVKVLELAIARAATRPEAAQEQIGRELLARINALSGLRAAIAAGIRELDYGEGEEIDIEECISRTRHEGSG